MVNRDMFGKFDLALEPVALLPPRLGTLGVGPIARRAPGVLGEVVHQVLDGGRSISQPQQKFIRRRELTADRSLGLDRR